MLEITIYTDGSCIGNPGPGGWAAIILHDDKEIHVKGHEKAATNNRMEMMAIIKALEYLHKEFATQLAKTKIRVYSDSNLIIQTLNLGWKRKANTDLWARLDKLRAWLNISWTWVKGHSTNKLNNLVDDLALTEAKKATRL